MVSTLLKTLMRECRLNQAELAEVMEVKLQRVRDLASGRAKKLTREESDALIRKLVVRADWLITGEGPVFGESESQDGFAARIQAINRMHALVNAMPLGDLARRQLCAVMTGDPDKDGALIADAVREEAAPGAVDVALVVKIAAIVEADLTKNRARLSLAKKEELVRLLHDHFALKGCVEEETIERHLRLVVNQ